MNHEIIFLHQPESIVEKNFALSEEEFEELDKLAEQLLEPNKNFERLVQIWETEQKFRILRGALN